jgi:hypothetical protein
VSCLAAKFIRNIAVAIFLLYPQYCRGNIADKLQPRNINVSFTNSNVPIDVIDKSLTGEPILPSRTADQYLAVNQFYRREPRTNMWPDIGPRSDIGPRFATVKLVHRSEIYHKSSPSAHRTPEGEIDGSPVIEPQKWGPMETGRATPGDSFCCVVPCSKEMGHRLPKGLLSSP